MAKKARKVAGEAPKVAGDAAKEATKDPAQEAAKVPARVDTEDDARLAAEWEIIIRASRLRHRRNYHRLLHPLKRLIPRCFRRSG